MLIRTSRRRISASFIAFMSSPAAPAPLDHTAAADAVPDHALFDQALDIWLRQGCQGIGQVAIRRLGDDRFQLCHESDRARLDDGSLNAGDLRQHDRAEAARQIALHDDNGDYRPLKTAPNLRRGWLLDVTGVRELRLALDFLYPAAVALWRRHLQDKLRPVSLRQALQRQTGMYRFAGNISHEGAVTMVRDHCRHGSCLRKVRWDIEPGQGNPALDAGDTDPMLPPWGLESGRIPLLCIEVCCHVVAAARKVARAEFNTSQGKPELAGDGHHHDHHHGHGHAHGHSHD